MGDWIFYLATGDGLKLIFIFDIRKRSTYTRLDSPTYNKFKHPITMYNANARRVSQEFLISHSPSLHSPHSGQSFYEHDIDAYQNQQQYGRRYTPVSISRSLAAGIVQPSTNYALAEDFPDYYPPNNKPDRPETESMDNYPEIRDQQQQTAVCWICDCANTCFCYPVCGCDKLYSTPHTMGEFTLYPLMSASADASCLCAGVESPNEDQVTKRRNMTVNTVCIPFAGVVDLITLVPRMFVSACSYACYS